MKRKITRIIWLPVSWCVILVLNCASQHTMLIMDFGERFDRNSEGLQGKIKECRKKSPEGVLHTHYDIHGNKILERKFTPRMKIDGVTKYKNEYYPTGKIKRCAVYFDGTQTVLQEYNEYGSITLRTVRMNGGMISFRLKYREGPSGITTVTVEKYSINSAGREDLTDKTVETYERGHCIKQDQYHKNGNLANSEKTKIVFNGKGLVIEKRSGATEASFAYDDRGRILLSKSINHAGAFGTNVRYAYGPKGFPRSKRIEEFSPATRRTINYTYDNEGKLLEAQTDTNGNDIIRETFKHDETGNVLEKKTVSDGRVTTEKYEYVYWQ